MSIVLQGSTSGSITLQEPAVAGSTVLSLPATSGTLITTGSTGQVIPKAALPTGSVLQVVHSATQTQVSSTSGETWVDTGLTASITPTSSSSKILVLVSQNGLRKQAVTNSGVAVSLQLLRGSSVIANIGNDNGSTDTTANGGYNTVSASTCFLDSPATTSSTTYKVQFNNARNVSDTVAVQYNGARSTITLLEIAA